MADFVGKTVQVTLKQPPNTILLGRIQDVVAGQTLALKDVVFPDGSHVGHWNVQAHAIADLQVIDANALPSQRQAQPSAPPQSMPPPEASIAQSQPRHQDPQHFQRQNERPRAPPSIMDPAILSYTKRPSPSVPTPPLQEAPATPVKSMLAKAAESLPTNTSPFVAEPTGAANASRKASRIPELAAHSPLQPRPPKPSTMTANEEVAETAQELGDAGGKKKLRRGHKKKGIVVPPTSSDPPPIMNAEVSRNGNDMNGSVKRGKGWRQTPLLQPSPQNASAADLPPAAKKASRRQREQEKEAQNGWATEDATDVQDLGDFDFEASNLKFDKKGVFDELKRDDTTADEDRLAGHNRVARPGTYGGKNLHPTENVLSPKLQPKHLSNEDSSSDADTELNFANGRSSSKHSVSRTTLGTKQPSRQNSAQVDGKPLHLLTASMSSDRGGVSRSAVSLASRGRKPAPSIAASPRPDRGRSPHSTVPAVKTAIPNSDDPEEPHFILAQTLVTCPVLHPNALDTLEAETTNRYGLSPEAITESAARCVAEIAMTMFDPSLGSRRGSRANTIRGSMSSSMLLDRSQPPVIVILAGNHTTGARAIAASRHFVTRKSTVIVAEALYESSETRDEQARLQTSMVKRMQRGGAKIKRGAWRKASNYIKHLAGPPAIIIDALLAGSTYDSLLDPNAQHAAEAQKEAREMIDLANRSRAPVLSVGCPSGVSGLDGSATIVEGEPLAVRPDKVLALGAPMQGLLEATKGGERWEISLADIGINIALRSEEAVAFGAQWITGLKFAEDAGVLEA
ncbi:enhancer of mRNA-decapping protein 3-like [Teratosphaeria destructans]|uniref:Enhancer of mRNA-decapping protein 3 n=1 Tax=Teratosphaeria destructans TaxID=418781 RepID=A0A9W7SRN7_9PEZI|nr:enhancer of mRNA-decapping protein 3-like [Teratosphaeria destructans]